MSSGTARGSRRRRTAGRTSPTARSPPPNSSRLVVVGGDQQQRGADAGDVLVHPQRPRSAAPSAHRPAPRRRRPRASRSPASRCARRPGSRRRHRRTAPSMPRLRTRRPLAQQRAELAEHQRGGDGQGRGEHRDDREVHGSVTAGRDLRSPDQAGSGAPMCAATTVSSSTEVRTPPIWLGSRSAIEAFCAPTCTSPSST